MERSTPPVNVIVFAVVARFPFCVTFIPVAGALSSISSFFSACCRRTAAGSFSSCALTLFLQLLHFHLSQHPRTAFLFPVFHLRYVALTVLLIQAVAVPRQWSKVLDEQQPPPQHHAYLRDIPTLSPRAREANVASLRPPFSQQQQGRSSSTSGAVIWLVACCMHSQEQQYPVVILADTSAELTSKHTTQHSRIKNTFDSKVLGWLFGDSSDSRRPDEQEQRSRASPAPVEPAPRVRDHLNMCVT